MNLRKWRAVWLLALMLAALLLAGCGADGAPGAPGADGKPSILYFYNPK